MTQRTIAVVSAGPRVPSSTRLLADQLGVAVAATLSTAGIEARVTTIELREHAHAIADALITGFASGTLAEAIAEVVGADGIIVVTPTFGATYSGLFKSFIDALEPDSLRDKPILLAATGGTERHSLMLDYALRPLLSHLKARPVPTAVYAATADFGGAGAVELASRVNAAAAELAAAVAPAHSDDGPIADLVLEVGIDDCPFGLLKETHQTSDAAARQLQHRQRDIDPPVVLADLGEQVLLLGDCGDRGLVQEH